MNFVMSGPQFRILFFSPSDKASGFVHSSSILIFASSLIPSPSYPPPPLLPSSSSQLLHLALSLLFLFFFAPNGNHQVSDLTFVLRLLFITVSDIICMQNVQCSIIHVDIICVVHLRSVIIALYLVLSL